MKKVKRRAWSALIISIALMLGMGVYVFRYAVHSRDWVFFRANQNVYQGGVLISGTVTDRDGVVLAHSDADGRSYAVDASVRLACLHAVGDFEGNIGTGALSAFSAELSGYTPISGVGSHGDVTLSISSKLCTAAYNALNGRSGCVLVSDYTTGEILCMVSTPSYDPDVGFDKSDPAFDGVYLNRALSSSYTPGSVFKLVTMAAAIENIDDIYERSFDCAGSVTVDGMVINCTGTHGSQTIEEALANSCNCAFAQLSLELGGDTLAKYAKSLGLTEPQELDGISTLPGSFDSSPEGSAALAWSGIGQSTDLVCPYSMLRLVSAVANGGRVVGPTMLLGGRNGSERLLSADTAGKLGDMMSYNVAYAYGGEAAFPGLKLCAKSGTAEVGDGSSHAWFTGYLRDEEHPYAFVVMIEHGGGGLRNAGAVASTVLQAAITLDTNGEDK